MKKMKKMKKNMNEKIGVEYISQPIITMIRLLSVSKPHFVYVQKMLNVFNEKFLSRLCFDLRVCMSITENFVSPQCGGYYRNIVTLNISEKNCKSICALQFCLNSDETAYILYVNTFSSPTCTVTCSELNDLLHELTIISISLNITNIESFNVGGINYSL